LKQLFVENKPMEYRNKSIEQFIFCSAFVLFIGGGIACKNTTNTSDVTMHNAPKIINESASIYYLIDTKTSKIKWICGYQLVPGDHNGNLTIKEGRFIFDGNAIVGGNIIFDMKSITNNDISELVENEKLVRHLKSVDFFNTDSFPTAAFTITAITFKEDVSKKAQPCTINGDLTIKNTTQPISLEAALEDDGNNIRLVSSTSFDRKKWNLNYGSKSVFKDLAKDEIISDEIELQLDIRATKK
jgi:polyisoprenoid-binding protein YceI